MIKGSTRYVLSLPRIGLVIKFPVIRVSTAWKALRVILRSKNRDVFEHLRLEMFEWTYEMYGTIKRFLFLGIAENWHEYAFSRNTKNMPIKTTFFSLFGLCNIQQYGKPLEIPGNPWHLWWKRCIHVFGSNTVIKDGHHFENPKNFCREGDMLIYLDYGSKKTQKVM